MAQSIVDGAGSRAPTECGKTSLPLDLRLLQWIEWMTSDLMSTSIPQLGNCTTDCNHKDVTNHDVHDRKFANRERFCDWFNIQSPAGVVPSRIFCFHFMSTTIKNADNLSLIAIVTDHLGHRHSSSSEASITLVHVFMVTVELDWMK